MKPQFFKLSKAHLTIMKPITSVATLDRDDNFEPEGLFSNEIFGRQGSAERMTTFAYIKLNTELISPGLFHEITKLSGFYKKVIFGQVYAIWDDKKKIFEESNYIDGRTGFKFFLEHINDIKWKTTDSVKRDQKIAMIKKYADEIKLDNFVVLPAGLRDYMIKDGKATEDEINTLYRKLLGLSFLLEGSDGYAEANDVVRVKMQLVLQEIYGLVFTFSEGKNGFIQGKFTKRGILGGTRNVITASMIVPEDLKNGVGLSVNDSTVGLYQYCMGISTKMDNLIRVAFMDRILGEGTDETYPLVDPKTGKMSYVKANGRILGKILGKEGLQSYITDKLKVDEYVHQPLMVGKYYLANVYDDGTHVKVMFDNTLPDGFHEKHVRPMTVMDAAMIALGNTTKRAVGMMTRYPVTGQGSIYPTMLKVKPTVNSRKVTFLNDNWEPVFDVPYYHNVSEQIYTSMAVHVAKYGNLDADTDGDKLSLTIILTKEAIEECINLMGSREFYIRPDGQWVDNMSSAITGYVLKHITRGLNK